ncbi:MAG: aminotransferase class I/II-fold pyridoxal phosphate-dependent enzyme [Terriglobales bacterium]
MGNAASPSKQFLSDKSSFFTESVIRDMTRQAMLYSAVNLAQGFPDFPAPAEIKLAARNAIANDVNQYAITWGAKNLRDAIARHMQGWQNIPVDPETQITVCCGSTEAMISTLLATCNPGDEGRHLRAVLRKLRARFNPLRRKAALRKTAPADL